MPEMQQQQRGTSLLPAFNSTNTSSSIRRFTADPHIATPIPPWVHTNTGPGNDRAHLLIPPPEEILPNTRHYKPPPLNYRPGRKWDHLRTAEPAFLSAPIAEEQQRWQPFMLAGPNPQATYGDSAGSLERGGGARVVNRYWMDEHMPSWNQEWRPEDEIEAGMEGQPKGFMYKGLWLISPERQERTVKWFWRVLLKNPFVPLGFRLTVLAFSAAALALAASIYSSVQTVNHDGDPNNQCSSRASTYMGLIVDTLALPYIAYVTWDEYMSKPLGLRSVAAKILLLLCDLYFIVFSAANLSLAFDALEDRRWACYDEQFVIVGRTGSPSETCPNNPSICYKQKALSSVLLISLLAWLLTFSLSVLRVVEKLRPD